MLKKQAGYSLIEMMIVVSIMTLTIPIVSHVYVPLSRDKKLDYFIEELKANLYDAQMTALAYGTPIRVTLRSASHEIVVNKGFATVIRKQSYDSHITISKGTHQLRITFLANGNVQQPGTIFISSGERQFKLVLQLGQGRFYVEEQ